MKIIVLIIVEVVVTGNFAPSVYTNFRAYSYRREFLAFDGFDNYFITKTLQKMDTKRQLRKLPTVFPLIKVEIWRYVHARKSNVQQA